MARGGRVRIGRGVVVAVAMIPVVVVGLALALGSADDARRAVDRLRGSDTPAPVAPLREGATAGPPSTDTWTFEVPTGQTLLVDAAAVELVRNDEGSRIDNASPDRILLAAEGGHPYTLTLTDGRWWVVAEVEARRAFCDWQGTRGVDGWGVRYRPSSWPADPC